MFTVTDLIVTVTEAVVTERTMITYDILVTERKLAETFTGQDSSQFSSQDFWRIYVAKMPTTL